MRPCCYNRAMTTKPTASGICFVTDDSVLLLKRAAEPHFGTWAFPGGKIEPGESSEEAARREFAEECGMADDYAAPLVPLWQTADGFQCFGRYVGDRFAPDINNEHSDWGWFKFDELPDNLHPSLHEGADNMPLIEGKRDKARAENIKTEVEAGKDPKQAAAIGYAVQRRAEGKDADPIGAAFDALHAACDLLCK